MSVEGASRGCSLRAGGFLEARSGLPWLCLGIRECGLDAAANRGARRPTPLASSSSDPWMGRGVVNGEGVVGRDIPEGLRRLVSDAAGRTPGHPSGRGDGREP